MERKRRKFSKEFIDEAVRLYLTSEKTQEEIANDLGCASNSLSRWVTKYQKDQEAKKYPGETADQKVARLERELALVKHERDILKKSIGIVSKV